LNIFCNNIEYGLNNYTEKSNQEILEDDNLNVFIRGTKEVKANANITNDSWKLNRLIFGMGCHLTSVKEKNSEIWDADTIVCEKGLKYSIDHFRTYMDAETHIIFQSSPHRWEEYENIKTWDDFWAKTTQKKFITESKTSKRYTEDDLGLYVLEWRNGLTQSCEKLKNKLWFKILVNDMSSNSLSNTNFDEKYAIWYDMNTTNMSGWKIILSLKDIFDISDGGSWKTYNEFINIKNQKDTPNGTKITAYYKNVCLSKGCNLVFPFEDLKNIKYELKKQKKNIENTQVKFLDEKIIELLKFLQVKKSFNNGILNDERDCLSFVNEWCRMIGFDSFQEYENYNITNNKKLLFQKFISFYS